MSEPAKQKCAWIILLFLDKLYSKAVYCFKMPPILVVLVMGEL